MKTLLTWWGLVAAAAFAGAGCDGGASGLQTMGMLGVPSPALVGANIILVSASLNHHDGGRLLVDTGSPYTLVDPADFSGATLPLQQQVNVDITLGALTIDSVPSIQIMTGTMDSLHLAGILGANVLKQFPSQFNYRDQNLVLGNGSVPDGVAVPGTTLPFKLEGGSKGPVPANVIPAPTTRVPVTVTIEGVDHPFIVDTGASEVTVRSSVFAALTADGRARLSGLPIQTANGSASGEVARARTVVVAGESVSNVPFLTLNDDSLLDQLAQEVEHPIDGLLGGTYLREFLLTIDYPKGMLHLQRYATRDHIHDEFQRVGIQIGSTSAANTYAIGVVYAGSDAAAKGLSVNDVVVSIDGMALSAFNPIAADALLQGPVGATRAIGFGNTSNLSLAGTTVNVRIDDLVPAS